MDFSNITFDELYQEFLTRLSSDPHFKNISSATIFGMFLEQICASTDMITFSQQRMLEEMFYRTARLDSSYIKLGKLKGYNIRRPVPAHAELAIRLHGPFPKDFANITEPVTLSITNDLFDLSFYNNKFRLDANYYCELTANDLKRCIDPSWQKYYNSMLITSYAEQDGITYHKLQIDDVPFNNSKAIKCYQGEIKKVVFDKNDSISNKNIYQENDIIETYKIDDVSFSNWYSYRDPFGIIKDTNTDDITLSPETGITKVYALDDKHNPLYFDIEDNSIYLNSKILDNDTGKYNSNRICLMETTEDKKIQLSFSPLTYLSEGGSKSNNENILSKIYVEYLSTAGANANITGVKSSKLTNNKKVNITLNGKTYDITNNIQFILKTDIVGGKNFETKREMYDNGNAYFASMLKLVSKWDFINYFNSLNKPINVTNALVYPAVSVTPAINENDILYTLTSNMYTKIDNVWYPKNIMVETNNDLSFEGFTPENPLDCTTLYGNEYYDHITDYLKRKMSASTFYSAMHLENIDDDTEQYKKNIYYIDTKISKLTPTNTILDSLPPFMHYFDIVGDIKVSSAVTDLNGIKTEINNKIYSYLNSLALETREIYKSNITKLCFDSIGVESVDIDIKVSSIISPVYKLLQWNDTDANDVNKGVRLFCNRDLPLITTEAVNEIIIPKYDSKYIPISGDTIKGNTIGIQIKFKGDDAKLYDNKMHPCKITDYGSYIKIILSETFVIDPDNKTKLFDDEASVKTEIAKYEQSNDVTMFNYAIDQITLKVTSDNNFFTSSNLYSTDADTYGLSEEKMSNIKDEIIKWINDAEQVRQANRIIALPYTVNIPLKVKDDAEPIDNIPIRQETILRKGNIIHTVLEETKTLSEQTFWNILAPRIIKTYYPNITSVTKIDGEQSPWYNASKLIMDIYKIVKPALSDSILDENNNIVNYSMDQDIAVLRSMINVTYKDR